MLTDADLLKLLPADFEQAALAMFHHQYTHNRVYHQFVDFLKTDITSIKSLHHIPFLPVEFFKSQQITTGIFEPAVAFTSSGTTGQATSTHYVKDIELYNKVCVAAFEQFYGDIRPYTILALLPSYLERTGSSLVHMVQHFMDNSQKPGNGFYLDNFDKLSKSLAIAEQADSPVIIIGVSFALLDFATYYVQNNLPTLKHTLIIETGGMKGRRKELTRQELHSTLKNAFGVDKIASEYGMTELLSQAYATADGLFKTPPWMQVYIREINDPLTYVEDGRTGAINVIDMANVHSCAFLQLGDLGRKYADGTFEVLGRFNNSDIRGCNLMVG